jgi:pilus assembly protein CpaE
LPGPLSILIVDEDPDSRVITRRAIQRAQLHVGGEVGYGAAAVSLALSARPDVILLSVEEPVGRPLETAEALANALPDTPIIMYSSMNDPESVRRGMVFGARDFMVKPVQVTRLVEAVHTVLEQQERRQMRRAGALFDPSGRGTVITVAGAKGGIGKSVISVNLAVALRQETARAVAILDADTNFGDIATLMDLTPSATIAELLAHYERVDRESIRAFLIRHSSGVDILPGAEDGEVWERCTPEMLKHIIGLLAQNFDFLVINTRGALDPIVRSCIEVATLTLLVTSGEVSSIRGTVSALQRLQRWEIDRDRLKILLNRGARVNGFHLNDVKQAFGQDIFWQMPADTRIPVSVQLGQPVVLEADSPAGQNLAELARRIAGIKTPLTSPSSTHPILRHLTKLRITKGQ